MKIRKCFVSNSSSSSFVCDICGCDYSGWDACLNDADMTRAECGHIYCNRHTTKKIKDLSTEEKREFLLRCLWSEQLKNDVREADENGVNDLLEKYSDFEPPAVCCPCCTFETPTDKQLLEFICLRDKINKNDIKEEMKSKFKNYSDMVALIK